jgi:hypothetical protein
MTSNSLKLACIILILFISGCAIQKDELTLPVSVHLKVGISQDNSLDTEYLNITECQIGIESFWFEGRREAGTAIYFQTDPKLNLPIITCFEPVIISHFDIPQGVYNYMKWCIYLKSIENKIISDIETAGWGPFDWMDKSYSMNGIIISGYYESMDGSEIPFMLGISAAEFLSVEAFYPDGKSTFVLSVNNEYEATLLFSPEDIFRSISRESFEEAEISDTNGDPIILITSVTNKELYEILLYRFLQYARVIVQ